MDGDRSGNGDAGDDGGGNPTPASVPESLDPLFNLSDPLATFKQRFRELQSHLRSIDAALDSLSEAKPLSDLEQLCADMCSRGVRRYIASRLSSEPALRQSVPRALRKFAPDPAKLVLDCVGGFYLQGVRAFADGSPMVPFRRAAILALEFFLLSGDLVSLPKGAPASEEPSPMMASEAESVAVAWRKRMMVEGGISKASRLDASGLLLFVSCFGIPSDFMAGDVIQLIRASNWRDMVDALRRSLYLVPRIPGLLEEMARKGMGVEAVDLTFGFWMEDKITPQEILTSSLKKAKEASTRNNEVASADMKKAYERHVSALKSAARCLKEHNLDPDTVLVGWKVNDMITKLEKDITEMGKKFKVQGQSTTQGGPSRIPMTPGTKRKKSKAAASSSKKLTVFRGRKESSITRNHNPTDNGSLLVRSFDSRHLGHGSTSGLLAEASAIPAAGPVGRVGISPAASYPQEIMVEGIDIAQRFGITDPAYTRHAYPVQLDQRYPNPSAQSVVMGGLHHPSLGGFPGLLPTHLSNAPPVLDGALKPDLYRFADGI